VLAGGAASLLLVGCGSRAKGGQDAGPRTASITTSMGSYDVPLEPRRLLLMENRVELEVATVLGLRPSSIGVFYEFEGGPAPWVAPWVPYRPSGREETFDPFETSTERILALRPDLILSDDFWLREEAEAPGRSYEELVPAAPVVPIARRGSWREAMREVARWLEREEPLDRLLAEFDELRDSIIDRHRDAIAEATIALGTCVEPFLSLMDLTSDVPASKAMAELGGKSLELGAGKADFSGSLDLSEERLDRLDEADAALIWASDADSLTRVTRSPVWQRGELVRSERVVISEQNVGSGQVYTIMEAMRLLDRTYATLA
jgi:iron complex transport system substrate-binding protein